jgi:FkbM family methyltransferase
MGRAWARSGTLAGGGSKGFATRLLLKEKHYYCLQLKLMSIVQFFHRVKFLRRFAKKIGKNINIKQRFYSGYIFLNAVDHSWAWTGNRDYTTFDKRLQDFIHTTSKDFDYFIDMGSNLGVMTLGTLLANPTIKAVAIDPNHLCITLLKKSLKYNSLEDRCRVIEAAVDNKDGIITFDETGSVTGHISNIGRKVKTISFSNILNEFKDQKILVKIDIEGYETVILNDLKSVANLSDFALIIEVHPLGFNEAGNPEAIIDILKAHKATIIDLDGNKITRINPNEISLLYITFNQL